MIQSETNYIIITLVSGKHKNKYKAHKTLLCSLMQSIKIPDCNNFATLLPFRGLVQITNPHSIRHGNDSEIPA